MGDVNSTEYRVGVEIYLRRFFARKFIKLYMIQVYSFVKKSIMILHDIHQYLNVA